LIFDEVTEKICWLLFMAHGVEAGTMQTSAKSHLTSLAIICAGDTARCVQRSRCCVIVGRWRNDFVIPAQSSFPYLPVVSNPANNPCIQTVIRIATKI